MQYFLFAITLLFAIGCNSSDSQKDKDALTSVKPSERNEVADIIRNPVSANKPLDTTNVAKFEFEETTFDFGTVNEGDKVKHAFKFKNVGTMPLIISYARSTCGCTVPKWPKNAIAPGESSEISVVFNTTKKPNKQKKPIIITSNAYPSEVKVYLQGTVTPDPNIEKKMMEELKKGAGL